MFKQTATDLTKVSVDAVKKWINSFDTVLSDCDGVQWIGRNLLPNSREVTQRFQELGKEVYFLTNMPNKTREELESTAKSHGYNIDVDHIVSAPYAAAKYLQKRHFNKKVFLIGQPGVAKELENAGIEYINTDCESNTKSVHEVISDGINLDPAVGAVIVGFDEMFSYSKILHATNYLKNEDCLFIGTSLDEIYPTKNGTVIPATAPNIRAIETSSNRTATIVGKPSATICESLLADEKIIPERTLMIGDSAKFDILLGANCGFQTLFVGSGVNSLDEVHAWQKSDKEDEKKLIPDAYLPTLGDLLPFLD